MMLYLIKYSRPDIADAVRALSKVNHKANYAHYKQMLRAVKYVLHMRNRMLKFIPENNGEKRELKFLFFSLGYTCKLIKGIPPPDTNMMMTWFFEFS